MLNRELGLWAGPVRRGCWGYGKTLLMREQSSVQLWGRAVLPANLSGLSLWRKLG